MSRIIAIAGSISSDSINKKVLKSIATKNTNIEILELENYLTPFYSSDEEKANGVPEKALALLKKFNSADAIIISSPEYNGQLSAAFKNTIDWMSRAERLIFGNKPTLLISASPGARGGASVLKLMNDIFPRFGADIAASVSIGKFNDVFQDNDFDTDTQLKLNTALALLAQKTKSPQD